MHKCMIKLLKKENVGIIILVGLIIVGVCLAHKYDINQYITTDGLDDVMESFGKWGPWAFTGLCALRPLTLLPTGLFSIAGGYAFGFIYGTIYAYTGTLLGTFLAFVLARYFGSGFVNNLLERALKGRAADVFAQIRSEKAFSTVFLLRIVPVLPMDAVSYGSGLTNIRFKDYALATTVSMVHTIAAYAYMGSMARNVTVSGVTISVLLYIVITIVPIVLAIRFNKIPILNTLLKELMCKLKNRKQKN